MVLLSEIFLRDLQLHGSAGFLHVGEERGNRLPNLEVNWPIFDLDDDVVVKLAIQILKEVDSRIRTISLPVGVIELIVHECTEH